MTIGEALAEARYRAGLTVDELSERTKIREAVIRRIEQDDYAACGGDIYVRGYVRAIAGAVGIDAQPLIRDFDTGRAGAAAGTRSAFAQGQDLAGSSVATVPEPPTVIDMPAVADTDFTIADPGFSIADTDFTIADPEFTFADEEFTAIAEAAPAEAAPAEAAPAEATPAEATLAEATPAATPVQPPVQPPVKPRPPSAWRARTRSRRWVTSVAILVVIALAVAGFAGSRIVSHLRQHNAAGNAATVQQQRAANQPTPGTTGTASKPAPAKAGKTTPARKPKTHATHKAPRALPVTWLPIKLAMAFGPDGTADGDNPQSAQFAVADRAPSPWQTDWYASPEFGMLKSGTGLLLDMGRTVTITSMLIDLSPYRGANLQIRLGSTPSDLHVAARADDVGAAVRLKLSSPLRARYVLIWFTLLPPNDTGVYQESVSRVVVNGRR